MLVKKVTSTTDYSKYVGKQTTLRQNAGPLCTGDPVTITALYNGFGNGIIGFTVSNPAYGTANVQATQLTLPSMYSTKEAIESKINELKTKINAEETKLSFMKETGSDEYSEDEFKAYSVLKLVEEGNLSTYEKSKKIAELVRG